MDEIAPEVGQQSKAEPKIESLPTPEKNLKKKVDILIVFGQGPGKPVLLREELSEEQKIEWENIKKNLLHRKEPDFRGH